MPDILNINFLFFISILCHMFYTFFFQLYTVLALNVLLKGIIFSTGFESSLTFWFILHIPSTYLRHTAVWQARAYLGKHFSHVSAKLLFLYRLVALDAQKFYFFILTLKNIVDGKHFYHYTIFLNTISHHFLFCILNLSHLKVNLLLTLFLQVLCNTIIVMSF